jgi:hypothetical protein
MAPRILLAGMTYSGSPPSPISALVGPVTKPPSAYAPTFSPGIGDLSAPVPLRFLFAVPKCIAAAQRVKDGLQND